nr:transposase [Gloeocapsa sp. PCC 7428]
MTVNPCLIYERGLFGKIFADRGDVSQKLTSRLFEDTAVAGRPRLKQVSGKDFGIEFFAKPRRNMNNQLMRLHDKLLSRQRCLIETINDQLKNISHNCSFKASKPR